MATSLQRKVYTLDMLRDETRALVYRRVVDRQQPIYGLSHHIPDHRWECFKLELANNEFLLRDRIIDLLSQDRWEEDT
ncbi:hypothetical protein S7335_4658 [Synechococcus sp. PCC 7335]|uniref:DUF4327 family protein n=1 Tax=Synechococcus sp. (strain ATCC 29403 / PCC 7335) TaxID=91464 RepID=UPI00017EE0E5|nr:DUF4327 family protein [Synechococcus sp. PCC 7335]EDX86951.1 hypothetical protein S7335_4658 [Synechococcus sp. PCC 7335]